MPKVQAKAGASSFAPSFAPQTLRQTRVGGRRTAGRVSRRTAVQTQAKVQRVCACAARARASPRWPRTLHCTLPSLIAPSPHTPCPQTLASLQLGDSLSEFLLEATPDVKLRTLLTSMSECIRTIAYKVGCVMEDDATVAVCMCVCGSGGGWLEFHRVHTPPEMQCTPHTLTHRSAPPPAPAPPA